MCVFVVVVVILEALFHIFFSKMHINVGNESRGVKRRSIKNNKKRRKKLEDTKFHVVFRRFCERLFVPPRLQSFVVRRRLILLLSLLLLLF